MSCAEVREKLPLFIGGDLDSDVLEAVRGHLDLCAECARRAGDAARARRELVSAFRSRESQPLRPELWSGIRATLRAEGLIRDPARREVPRPVVQARRARWSLVLAPVAAAAAILAVVQLGGFFAGPETEGLPAPRDEAPISNGGIAVVPVSGPVHGSLRNVPASDEPITLPLPYRGRQRAVQPDQGISAAAYNGIK